MDMSQYLEIFIEESKEHLQGLNQALLELEQNPQHSSVLNEIFRVAHTLKGMSGTMGYTKMAKLTHDMENVLHSLRSNEIKINTNLVDLLFKCLDALENYLNNIVSVGNEGNNEYKDIIQALNQTVAKKACDVKVQDTSKKQEVAKQQETKSFQVSEFEQKAINKALDQKLHVFKITVLLNKGCVLKSARAFIIFQTLERFGEIIKSEPRVEDIEDEKFDFEFTVSVISSNDQEIFNKELNSIAEVDKVIIEGMQAQKVDEASDEVKEALEHLEDRPENEVSSDGEAAKAVVPSTKPKTGKTVRVDIERLDVLMNLVSELIIQKTTLEGIEGIERTPAYNEAVEYLERITTSLHDAVMKVRMVPVETVFNRFPRMIRDISRDLGKEILLTMSGEETELDRTVIDEIGDPLIHLLRNSADHGIESPEKRAEKPLAGHIYLRAYQDGNNVVIEVEDDGAGINVERVKKKAIEKGLINKEIANTLSQKEIIDFLFKPSFSTVDTITDLSGRGVGLDVVKTKIEALGGMIEVETEVGKGTKFIIRLPLTLAIIQALLVSIGQEKYAIPLGSIREIINITPDQIKFVQKKEVYILRDMVIPLIRLDHILDVPKDDKVQKQLTVVVVKKGDKHSGFLVDSLIGQQEIVIKSLGKLLVGIKMIAGATILGDGKVALILDVNSLA